MRDQLSTLEALIAQHRLGQLKKLYKPRTTSSIILGMCIIAFACIWIIIAMTITLAMTITSHSLAPTSYIPVQGSAFPSSTGATFSTVFTILGFIFPLFGLIFVGVGLSIVIRALLNKHIRAALCEYGIAYLGPEGADAFRWEQVATVLDKVNVHVNRTDESASFTRISHTYTVVCKDGRRFVFKGILGQEEQLAEEIQIATALYKNR